MAKDKASNRKPHDLAQAVKVWSDEPLKKFREHRAKFLKLLGGKWFGDTDMAERQAFNCLYTATSIFLPALYIEPKAKVWPKANYMLAAFGSLSELVLNWMSAEIGYAETLRKVVMDALWSRGITVSGVADSPVGADDEGRGWLDDPGRPSCRRLSEVNFIDDMGVTEADTIDFRGHRFWQDYEYAMDTGMYDKAELEKIHDRQKGRVTKQAKESKGADIGKKRLFERVWLASIWVPKDKAIRVMDGFMDQSGPDSKYLRDDEYVGPETGPYNILTFLDMPDSRLPIPPMSMAIDLHGMINTIFGKIEEQAENQADIPVVQPGHEKEGKAFLEAKDGVLVSGDPTTMKVHKRGGVDKGNWEAMVRFREAFNAVIGNPNVIGGQEAEAPTLGQEEMLFAGASMPLNDKRRCVRNFAGRDFKAMAHAVWYDEDKESGLSIELPMEQAGFVPEMVKWSPGRREGDFAEYNFGVQAYGARGDSPEEQFNRIVTWLNRVVMPMMQVAAAKGKAPDVEAITRETGGALDIPWADQVWADVEPAGVGAPSPSREAAFGTKLPGRRAGARRAPAMAGAV